ncbi:MAG TPA: ATP-dependent 6-phosphofructokinase [Acidimicrobiia bacterium]|nr:ATP-dependent 6-phosphofructokinase [Acidimicrobiia bacterium]
MAKNIGIITAGGDSPGLNAAIRAIGKSAIRSHDMAVIGFLDGFQGLMQNRFVRLEGDALSGILTVGGTILGTGRDKPHKMDVGGESMDMTGVMLEHADALGLDALVAIGGGGTQKNALRLTKRGLRIITIPKTIDNDVFGTDATIGFDTALMIATEAVDRLHSTAHSHHRIIVVEIMGHNAGWLTLGAGLAGGADVILIPEIPYDLDRVAESITDRRSAGSTFSIVAVAEGSRPIEYRLKQQELRTLIASARGEEQDQARDALARLRAEARDHTTALRRALEERTGLEARVTILGHVQRGGAPSANDRNLATTLGTEATRLIADGASDVMVALRSGVLRPVPLSKVAGKRKIVPLDHAWIESARSLGISFGD